MPGIKTQGIGIAFVLSVGLHALGFGIREAIPRAPSLSKSTAPLTQQIRLIQTPIARPSQNNDSVSNLNSQLPLNDMQPTLAAIPSDRASQTTEKSEEQKIESVFAKPIRYFVSTEVDSSSELLSEWILRTESLLSIEKISIKLTLFISENGKLDKFEILETSLNQDDTEFLVRDLTLTIFQPAYKDGSYVASQKNVEILLEPTSQIIQLPKLLVK